MKVKTNLGEEFDVEFSQDFFTNFDGTDEELQELMTDIIAKIQDGTLFDEAEPLYEEELSEEEAELFMQAIENKRTLQ